MADMTSRENALQWPCFVKSFSYKELIQFCTIDCEQRLIVSLNYTILLMVKLAMA